MIKNMLVDWRVGEQWFWDTLVDADEANNPGNWQWVAGSGADAAPYFRVFNPVLQGEKFDPDGVYVSKWVPELARLPAKLIHQPWEASPMELAAARLVLEQIKDGLSLSYPTGAAQFDMGELDEGCAVLLVEINGKPVGAAFWTSEGVVHYVNEPARSLNPSLPAAPKHISEKRVRSVAH